MKKFRLQLVAAFTACCSLGSCRVTMKNPLLQKNYLKIFN